ncbi:unnamed protein product, partial [Heterotrigona itama]
MMFSTINFRTITVTLKSNSRKEHLYIRLLKNRRGSTCPFFSSRCRGLFLNALNTLNKHQEKGGKIPSIKYPTKPKDDFQGY